MAKKIEIGDKVNCKKFGSMKHDFVGIIEKKYENSAIVSITEHNQEDEVAVSDFHRRAVVRFSKMESVL